MAITIPVYVTREDVKAALDFKDSARSNAQIDRAITSAAGFTEDRLQRIFYPLLATREFDWPNRSRARAWELWLDKYELISASSITSGGVTVSQADYFLEPVNSGPPFTRVVLNVATDAAWAVASTWQHSIVIEGLWGYRADTDPAGQLGAALDGSATSATVSDSSVVGVGTALKAGTEWMLVTDKMMASTGHTLAADLGGQAANDALTVGSGAGADYAVGEVLLVDTERLLVVDIGGDVLTVKRAWDGSRLAAHTSGTTIYAPRLCTVTRGDLGTTAASHSSGVALVKNRVPALVTELNLAEALNNVLQETSGYSRTVGEGDSQRPISGAGLADIRRRAVSAHGRKIKHQAV